MLRTLKCAPVERKENGLAVNEGGGVTRGFVTVMGVVHGISIGNGYGGGCGIGCQWEKGGGECGGGGGGYCCQ